MVDDIASDDALDEGVSGAPSSLAMVAATGCATLSKHGDNLILTIEVTTNLPSNVPDV